MTTLNPPAGSYTSASPQIKPLPLGQAILFFAVPSLAVTAAFYWGVPSMVERGMGEVPAYLTALMIPLAGCFFAALIAYILEGRPLTWKSISDRLRLRRMTGKDWLWAFGGLLVTFIGFAMLVLTDSLINRGLIPMPSYIPAALDPAARSSLDAYKALMGPEAIGNWRLIGLILAVLFFNVIGEELYFRGYILPRQELAHGSQAWKIHFALWTVFHVFQYWQVLYLVTMTLPISYIAQRRQNTWPGIVIHGLHNIISMSGMVLIILRVTG